MNRRQFIKKSASMATVAGLNTFNPLLLNSAAGSSLKDHFFIFVSAQGGWDPTSFCDPKGDKIFYNNEPDRGAINNFNLNEVRKVGPFSISPYGKNTKATTAEADSCFKFFKKYQQKILLLNGVDNGTNNHQSGTYLAGRGSKSAGMPNFGALLANEYGRNLAMPFLGGFQFANNNKGLTNQTDFSVFDLLQTITKDNSYKRNSVHNSLVYDKIRSFTDDNLSNLIASEDRQAYQIAHQNLLTQRLNRKDLERTTSFLPSTLNGGLKGKFERTAAAFASGNSIFAAVAHGNFDSHTDHDDHSGRKLNELFDGLDYLNMELERHGIADRTTIVVTSDIGRTPWYNDSRGKDHWAVTSYFLMGKGISGNRVVGATDNNFQSVKLDPTTLEFKEDGITLHPAHVHKALRRIAGIEGTFSDYTYSIGDDWLPILG